MRLTLEMGWHDVHRALHGYERRISAAQNAVVCIGRCLPMTSI